MKCKTGDLAYIIEAMNSINKGLVVVCKEYLGYYLKDDIVEISGERYKAIVSDNFWLIECEYGIETMFGSSKHAYCPDNWLQPIKKDELDSGVTTSKTLETNI